MADIKERYSFSSWPGGSVMEENGMSVNCRLEEDTGFELLDRRALPWSKSYEDIYQSREDADIRISVKVINCESFEEAKEQLASHLSQCAAYKLPQVTGRMDAFSADIAFGAADGSGKAIRAVRGNAVVLVRNIGRRAIDLFPVYGMLNERIHLARTKK